MKNLNRFLVILVIFSFFSGSVFAQETAAEDEEVDTEAIETEEEEVVEEVEVVQEGALTEEEIKQAGETKIVQEKGVVRDVSISYVEAADSGEITSSGFIEGTYKEQTVTIEVLSGGNDGQLVTVKNDVYGNPFDIEVEEGDKVFLYAQMRDGMIENYFIRDYWHSDGLIFWSVIFLLLVLAVGRMAGVKAILSLGGSIFLVFFVLIPAIKNGAPPVLVTVGMSALIILITHLIITGVGKKSWAAMAGTLGGVLIAAVLVYLIGSFASVTGLGTEDSRILAVNYPEYNFQAILFSGIILGALGAVMDTGISIASGLSEIKEHKPDVSVKQLIKSGMNIGRDIMGSMINTLIFAYIGASLGSILLFSLLQTNFMELINYGFIAEEVVRSLVGSLGLLATIPLTAVIAGAMMGKREPLHHIDE